MRQTEPFNKLTRDIESFLEKEYAHVGLVLKLKSHIAFLVASIVTLQKLARFKPAIFSFIQTSRLHASRFTRFLSFFAPPILHFGLSLFCIIMWCRVPLFIPFFILLAVAALFETIHYHLKTKGKGPPPTVTKISHFFIFPFAFFTCMSVLFIVETAPLIVIGGVASLYFLYFRKVFPFIRFLQFINIFSLGLFMYYSSHYNTRLGREVKLKGNTCATLTVRSNPARYIFTDSKEENLYFTTYFYTRQKGIKYKTLYRVPLTTQEKTKAFNYFFCGAGIYGNKQKKLFVINSDGGELLVLDPNTLKILKKQKIKLYPDGIVIDKKRDRIIVTYEGGELGAYDPESLKEKMLIHDGGLKYCGITNGVYSKKCDKIFIARQFTPFILTGARCHDLKTSMAKFMGLSSWGITLDHKEKYIYITDFFLGKIYKVNAKNFKIVRSARIKSGIRPVEIDDKRNLIYVGNYLNPYLLILNKNFRVIKKIFVGNPCRGLKLLKNGRLFAATVFGLVEIHVNDCLKGK